MPLFQDSLPILTVLMVNIIISERLARLPYLRHMGTALIVIILTAITSNLGLIPASTNSPPIYDAIFTYLAPVSIFFLLLTVNLKGLQKAGAPMIGSFLLGSIGTMLGVVAGMWVIGGPKELGELYYALGGMFAGTYTGGSSNFNAIALHYEVNKEGNLYAIAVAVDNIMTAIWMIVTLLLPPLLNRYYPRSLEYKYTIEEKQQLEKEATAHVSDVETFSPQDLAILVGMGAAGLYVSKLLATGFPEIPQILILTTLALVLAQLPVVQRLRGTKVLAMFCIYLFLAVIGAYCDMAALLKDTALALSVVVFVCTLVSIHALIQFGVGALFKQDWVVLSIASQANIGGSSTALALSKSLNRPDLHLPGILVGALGNAIGTYCGLLIAEFLKIITW